MGRRRKLYLETSVVSYYVSRPSRDLVVQAHREITRDFWERGLKKFDVFISDFVLQEARKGDPVAAKKRLDALADFDLARVTPAVETLARRYLAEGVVPATAEYDAFHMAVATVCGMDILVTWNCRHLANPGVEAAVLRLNKELGYATPILCTPEEALEG